MNAVDTYLDAIEAAVEAKDKKAMELLEKFASHVYHDLHAKAEIATGDEQSALNERLHRAQQLIVRLAQAAPSIWL